MLLIIILILRLIVLLIVHLHLLLIMCFFLASASLIFSLPIWLGLHEFIFFSDDFKWLLNFLSRLLSYALLMTFVFRIFATTLFICWFHFFNWFCGVGHSCETLLSRLIWALVILLGIRVCLIIWLLLLFLLLDSRSSKGFMGCTRLLPFFFWFLGFLVRSLILTKVVVKLIIIFFRICILLWSTLSSWCLHRRWLWSFFSGSQLLCFGWRFLWQLKHWSLRTIVQAILSLWSCFIAWSTSWSRLRHFFLNFFLDWLLNLRFWLRLRLFYLLS